MKVLLAGYPEHMPNYETALKACGADYDICLHPENLNLYDRLLLPGGGDIHPSFFGQYDQGSRNIDPELDKAQFVLLDAFAQKGKPVLGICRGLQLLNVYFGGDIIQDLPDHLIHHYIEKDQYHPLKVVPGTQLYQLYGEYSIVNSAHHQSCGRIGHGLIISQTAPDGIIEGLEHTEKPVLGVQWHPERTGFSFKRPGIADGELLIRYFLSM